MFAEVVGQERAIATLEQAAQRPAHAYLLVGPSGSGVVERGVHPDVVEFEPSGASYLVEADVRKRILPEAARAPIEGERKVLILFEAERLRGNQNESANAMLKTLE